MQARGGRPRPPAETVARFWAEIRRGSSHEDAAVAVNVTRRTGNRWFNERGGVMPPIGSGRRSRSLSFAEREEIALLRVLGAGVRELDRSPSTISRELRRVQHHGKRPARRRLEYRASTAQADADRQALRPKQARLATNDRLRDEVQSRLVDDHSPEQIARRLREDFPDDPEMWVSHETIYQSLYVQSRGALKRELAKHLRTGRTVRKPHRKSDQRRERFAEMVMISERPAEVEDRAVPGHWEGDLILGSAQSGSAVGTLVERTTRFVMLLHLPGGHSADIVQEAMVAKMATLPEQLRVSLTWDQGSEMANHVQIAEATGLDIYFCDPHSPWQRGSNENTNGLLRQYLPKGADLSFYGPGMLDNIAAQLNRRPRKTLKWRTPAETLDALLSGESEPPGVATTG
ncbi:IS30 family transposase [Nocardioides okcheonensis]|uniref:IS30 family transposase n=1 Tax=Nocardioides okcheonensis TaxID=2894081 RepID=UPI001E3D3A8F|nr:IS30 family transposase [Nocardioides okcheonensis]UFN44236.1 IS30 family transposase [Nocardioides okcheonensis]